jgi:hypothetical protein
VARLAAATPFDVLLDVLLLEVQSRRTAVDDAAQRRAVALAETGDSEKLP